MIRVLEIDFDKKCAECQRAGAADSGICLRCIQRAMMGRQMKSKEGNAVQKKIWATMKKYG